MADEIALLGLFADFAELSRNRPAGEELHTELRVHSSKEHFHTYLQSLDAERGGLPDQFRDRLARVLAHYGVTDLDRTPELEEAVFRIFLAQQRSAPDVLLVTALLQRWIAEPPPRRTLAGPARSCSSGWSGPPSCASRWSATWPGACGSAGSTSRWSTRSASSVLAGVRDEVAALAADPTPPDRTERIEALAAIPEQIVRFLAERLEQRRPRAGADARGADPPALPRVRPARPARRCRARADRSRSPTTRSTTGRPTWSRPIGTVAELADPDQRAGHRRRRGGRRARPPVTRPSSTSTCTGPTRPESPEQATEELARHGRRAAVRPRRTPGRGRGLPRRRTGRSTTSPTARSPDGGVIEDDLVRGVHPMVGRRLDLWRLRDFDVTRLDAPEDVLLYDCVARENPADRRLVALAQVRQLAVVRDEEGRSPRCRTRSGRWRTAWRRSAGPAPRAARPGASST